MATTTNTDTDTERGSTDSPMAPTWPDEVDLAPPDIHEGWFATIREFWRLRRHRKKRKKHAKQGYIKWLLINGTYPEAKYVKPKPRGGGLYEYKYKGQRYLMPREAMLPSTREGMWTVVHKEGEVDPINLRDPSAHAIKGDILDEYLTLRVTSSPPSLFDKINLDPKNAITYAIAALIIIVALQGALGGGF